MVESEGWQGCPVRGACGTSSSGRHDMVCKSRIHRECMGGGIRGCQETDLVGFAGSLGAGQK
jgi:hypothetical protein